MVSNDRSRTICYLLLANLRLINPFVKKIIKGWIVLNLDIINLCAFELIGDPHFLTCGIKLDHCSVANNNIVVLDVVFKITIVANSNSSCTPNVSFIRVCISPFKRCWCCVTLSILRTDLGDKWSFSYAIFVVLIIVSSNNESSIGCKGHLLSTLMAQAVPIVPLPYKLSI